MADIRLVCFDLDDTLTREIDSVKLLCMLNDSLDPVLAIDRREAAGELHWIEADHHRARLLRGLAADRVREGFRRIMKPIEGILPAVESLHGAGMHTVLITAGPVQVARAAAEEWGFGGFYGSEYVVEDGIFIGEISSHIGDSGKVACLREYCAAHGIAPEECAAVGDGVTDLPLFRWCGLSIAFNGSPAAEMTATYAVRSGDLRDILPHLLREKAEPAPIPHTGRADRFLGL